MPTIWTPEYRKQKRKEYYEAHKSKESENAKEWREKNYARQLELNNESRNRNKEEWNAKRRVANLTEEEILARRQERKESYQDNIEEMRRYFRNKHNNLSPEERYRKNLQNSLRAKYDMSIEEFETMNTKQKGLCAACGGPPQHRRRRLDVDHDHETGKVRALLCSPCNILLFYLEHHSDKIPNLLQYLEKYKPKVPTIHLA
jgi:Recombination endonuclease VII